MDSAWFRSTFLRVFKFLQIKEEGSNFWGKPILQKVWIICSPHLYFNFKSFIDQNFLSFIRFQWILHDSGVLFPDSSNFYKLKRGGPNFVGCLNYFFFNWDSLHARLNSHYEAWSYKKKSAKKITRIKKICLERTYS